MEKRKHLVLYLLITFLAILGIVSCTFSFSGCFLSDLFGGGSSSSSGDSGGLKTRSATNSDISFTKDDGYMNFIVKPYVDIDGLELSFDFLNDKDQILCMKTKTVGNVQSGTEYVVSFSASDFTTSQFFNISGYSCRVSGGTVTYSS